VERVSPSPPIGPVSVSVVVPSYNYGRFLDECIASVLRQRGVDLDVVIIDDASTDETSEVCARLTSADARIRVIKHASNLGHIATFNEALASGTSEFVVKLDADDCLPEDSLRRSAALLQRNPDVAFVYGHPLVFRDVVPQPPPGRVRSWTLWPGDEWLAKRIRRGHNVIMQPEVMIRRSALDAVGGHRPTVPASSDLNLWLRLAAVGMVGRVNGPVQGLYRVHAGNMHSTIHGGKPADLRARRAAFELFFEERAAVDPDVDGRLFLMRRTFARDALRLAKRVLDRSEWASEPIADYLAVAEELDPTLLRGARAQGLRLRMAVANSRWPGLSRLSPGVVAREIEDRARWRYWRRYGL